MKKIIKFHDKYKSLNHNKFIYEDEDVYERLDRQFREFRERYGIDKDIDDWINHIEKETKMREKKVN